MDNNFNMGDDEVTRAIDGISPMQGMPEQPTMQQPVQPVQGMPEQPTMQQPVQPMQGMPEQPMMQQPVQPVQGMPEQPTMQQPVQPMQGMPEQPTMQQPVQQVQGMPEQPMMQQPVQQVQGMPEQPIMQQPVQQVQGMPEQPMMQQPVQQVQGMPEQPMMQQPVGMQEPPVDMSGLQPMGMPQQPMMQQPVQPMQGMPEQPVQQMPGMPPVGPENPAGGKKKPKKVKVKKVKKPWSKGKIAAVAGGGAVLVAGIACAVIFFILPMFKPAKDTVVDAFEKMYEENQFVSDTNTMLDEQFGYTDIMHKYYEKGGDNSMSMSLNSIAEVEDLEGLDKFAIEYNSSINPIDKLLNYTMLTKYDGEEFLKFDFIGTEKNTYLAVPSLIDGYFMIPNEDFIKQLEESELGQLTEMSGIPNFSINYFPEVIATETDGEFKFVPEYVAAIEKLWDGVDVSKDGKAKINLHDDTVTAMEYTLTFAEDDIEDAAKNGLDGLVSQLIAAAEAAEEAGAEVENIDEMKASLTTAKTMIPSFISGDLVVKVYVKDKKVVKITTAPSTSFFGVKFGCDFSLDITDDQIGLDVILNAVDEEIAFSYNVKKNGDKIDGTFIMVEDEESLSASFNSERTEDDSKCTETSKLEVFANKDSVGIFVVEQNYDKSSKKLSGSYTANVEGLDSDVKAVYEGSVYDDVKGESLGIKLDSIKAQVGNESLVDFSIDYKIDASKPSAKDVDSSAKIYEALKLTEQDLQDIVMENQNRMLKWIMSLQKIDIFSSLMSTNNDDPVDYGNDIWDNPPTVDDDDIIATDTDATATDATATDASSTDADVQDTILKDDFGKDVVKIIAKIPHYELKSANGNVVNYFDEDNCGIEYSCKSSLSAEKYVEVFSNIDSYEYSAKKEKVEKDGTEIWYTVFENPAIKGSIYYVLAIDLPDGNILTMIANANDGHMDLESIVEYMTPSNYEMVE